MTKINQEEYEVLRELEDKWKWIARDEDKSLWVFTEKPFRKSGSISQSCWDTEIGRSYPVLELIDEIHLFQSIQWEDLEPHNITKLIEEYENEEFGYYIMEAARDYERFIEEPEEAEVNKNIKWLKEEIEEDIKSWGGGNPDYFRGASDAYENVKDWLAHLDLDEPDERTQLETAYKDILKRREFLFDDKEYVVVEKPVIPQFVADFISDKEDWSVFELFDDEWLYKEHDRIAKWIYDNDDIVNRQREADLVFARKNGYTIEEEQKYYVVNNDNRMMLVRMMDDKTITEADPFKLEDLYEGEKESHRLTEQEIKVYDGRYWLFAVPVEELEE